MSSDPLNVIALISGGKDSFYALQHCVVQGHCVVALANLYPPTPSAPPAGSYAHATVASHGSTPLDDAADLDLNSHMYQTAGHALIPLYASALPIPLYRGEITGTAVDHGREYAARTVPGDGADVHDNVASDADETEALIPLLRRIMAAHPEANALVSGAIQSTYQRTRVESVCMRLGLVPLAFLWQYDVLPLSRSPKLEPSAVGQPEEPGARATRTYELPLRTAGTADDEPSQEHSNFGGNYELSLRTAGGTAADEPSQRASEFGGSYGLPLRTAAFTAADERPSGRPSGSAVTGDDSQSRIQRSDELGARLAGEKRPPKSSIFAKALECPRAPSKNDRYRDGLLYGYPFGYRSLDFDIELPYKEEPPSDLARQGGALLEDMAAAGLDARIVKVASGGLDDSFLWCSLADARTRTRIANAMRRFGGSVLGEGGEFETVVVSGPRGLWRGRLEVGEGQRRVVRGEGGEAFLAFDGGQVVAVGQGERGENVVQNEEVRVPDLFDPLLWDVWHGLTLSYWDANMVAEKMSLSSKWWVSRETVSRSTWALQVSNLTGPKNDNLEVQMQDICGRLSGHLTSHGLGPSDLVFTTILLRSMADFARVNAVYARLFLDPIPPARVTVAVGECLPHGVDVMLSATATFIPRERRKGLHVQSRSYWAPANIGPYSQAVRVELDERNALAYIAGQIPLVPASMQVLATGHLSKLEAFRVHALLSAQHLVRIGKEMGVGWWTGAVAFLAHDHASPAYAKLAERLWRSLQLRLAASSKDQDSEDEAPDLWEQRFGGQASFAPQDAAKTQSPHLRWLDPRVEPSRSSWFLAVEVAETPRGCSIEWQSAGLVADTIDLAMRDGGRFTSVDLSHGMSMTISFHEFAMGKEPHAAVECLARHGLWDASEAGSRPATSWHAILYTAQPEWYMSARAQVIPCARLWGSENAPLHTAIVLLGEARVEGAG